MKTAFLSLTLSLMFTTLLSGCNGRSGLERYELSGMVTFQGEPVPQGQVRLTPDRSAGHVGPGSIAEIIDGKYRTPEGRGVVGGPYKVQILGYKTKPGATEETLFPHIPLFPVYVTEIELDSADAVIDFEVPETQEVKQGGQPNESGKASGK